MTKPYYYVSGVITSFGGMKNHRIMEEKNGEQVNIALVPYDDRRRDGWATGRKDALMIVKALNFLMENENANSSTS